MKKILCLIMVAGVLLAAFESDAQDTGKEWSKKVVEKWFSKKQWLNGVPLQPHSSVNKEEFARQYHSNKIYWDKAFSFLKEHNLDSLPKGKYPIDADNVFVSVTEDPTKNFENTNWESHRKYVDIQCIISGEEKMGVFPVAKAEVTKQYDITKDVANYTASGNFFVAGPGTFFLFFPSDAHRPNITPGGNKVVKKVVIKVRAAQLEGGIYNSN